MRPDSSPLQRVWARLFTKLARASALMFVGAFSGGILGYVFQVLMGRMLSAPDYGLFSAIMALYAVCSAPLSALLMVISRRVSEYRAANDAGSIRHFYRSVSRQAAIAGVLLLGVCVMASPHLQSYLRAANGTPVYLLGVLLFISLFPIVNDGFLQGLQKFSWLSGSGLLRVMLRIIFSALLVWYGYGVSGALGGTILALLGAWLITCWPLYEPLRQMRGRPLTTSHLFLKPAVPAIVAVTAFAAMTQLDMVLVNYYFPAHEAGLYAAASVLGKAVMYLPGSIAMALFPMVAENEARDRSSAHLLLQAVGLTAVMCIAGSLFYFVFGEWLMVALFGEEYSEAGRVLRVFGFAIFPMALVMVAEYFLIAKGRALFAYLFVATAPIQLLAIHFWHDSLMTVVFIVAASGTLLAAIGYAMLWRAFRAGPMMQNR